MEVVAWSFSGTQSIHWQGKVDACYIEWGLQASMKTKYGKEKLAYKRRGSKGGAARGAQGQGYRDSYIEVLQAQLREAPFMDKRIIYLPSTQEAKLMEKIRRETKRDREQHQAT